MFVAVIGPGINGDIHTMIRSQWSWACRSVRMHSAALGCGGLLFAIACCRAQPSAFWQAGHQYSLVTRVVERSPLTAEARRFFEPLSDTAQVRMEVDSLVRGALYGTCEGDFRHFGVAFSGGTPGRHPFTGRILGDST